MMKIRLPSDFMVISYLAYPTKKIATGPEVSRLSDTSAENLSEA